MGTGGRRRKMEKFVRMICVAMVINQSVDGE
jgi:hypothetical protein